MYPKITVVTPNFNQGRFIETTIQSVLSQQYPNIEYIIIDGGSTDNSVDIIRKYESSLAYWCSERDNGQYEAVQKGFSRASGEIMTYINSDDVLTTGSLFTIAQIFNEYPQIKWLGGVSNHIDENNRSVSIGRLQKWNRYRYLNNDYQFIQQEGVFWRSSLWSEAGGYLSNDFSLAADLELWSRFFQFEEYYTVNAILGSFRVRSENQRSLEGMDEYVLEAEKVLKKMKRSEMDRRALATANTFLYKLLKKRQLRFFFKFFGYEKVHEILNSYPPYLMFDRANQKFILEDN
jgi:glycosyltransferase involved in cell wall biosynthesis